MNSNSTPPKSRYTTVLPSLIEEARYEARRDPLPQWTKPAYPDQSRTGPQLEHHSNPPRNLYQDGDTFRTSPRSYHEQAALLADSQLPYQRLVRGGNTKSLAADLGLLDEASSSTSDRTTSTGVQAQSKGSDSSQSRYNVDENFKARIHEKESSPLHHESAPNGSKVTRHEVLNLTGQVPVPITPPKDPRRGEASLLSSPPFVPQSRIPPIATSRGTTGPPILDSRVLPPQIPSPRVAEHKVRKDRVSHFGRTEPQTKVEYEKVEGVKLDTRPAAASERKTGLSIPEIEARDIRGITAIGGDVARDGLSFENNQRFFAGTPSLPGANRHINTNTVGAGWGQGLQEYISHNQSSDRTLSDKSFEPPHVQSQDHSSLTNREDAISVPHIARHSHSSATRGSFDVPAVIVEESRQGSLDFANRDTEDPAEPPPIAMSKDFEERDSRMTRAINTAKLLLSKIW